MAAVLLDGKAMAREIRAELKQKVETLKAKGVQPGFGVLLVGDDPASQSYIKGKEKACAEIGVQSQLVHLAADASHEQILECVESFNADDAVHGILVQLPLPDGSIEQDVIDAIDSAKDVDGFHPMSAGRMMLGLPTFLPCTPHGIVEMLKRANVPVEGAHAVILGRSNLVGRPLANLLSQKRETGNATVTLCHTRTRDMAYYTQQADILVVAAGQPNMVSAAMVREGSVVIDVGVNRIADAGHKRGYRLVGDVLFDEVKEKAAAITPVPGGVGPMTIAMLMTNVVQAAEKRLAQ